MDELFFAHLTVLVLVKLLQDGGYVIIAGRVDIHDFCDIAQHVAKFVLVELIGMVRVHSFERHIGNDVNRVFHVENLLERV